VKKTTDRASRKGSEGSALVIALIFLVILTALGIYAVSVSVSEFQMATALRQGEVMRNAAEAGAYTGIDALPVMNVVTNATLSNGASYDITPTSAGSEPMPGFDSNWARAVFNVRATGRPQAPFGGQRAIDAGVSYGPIPAGTGY
jgi:type IV pilus assembly protein PilX